MEPHFTKLPGILQCSPAGFYNEAMPVSRRTFALGLSAAAMAFGTSPRPRVIERRVYDPGSVMPSREILRRNGIRPASVRPTPQGVEYRIPFASLEARAQAWDRFNTDPEWCALRDDGAVRLREVAVIV